MVVSVFSVGPLFGKTVSTCMELEPQTQSVARPRSTRSRHGSTSKSSARRPQSPDSAYEHDAEWVNGGTSAPEEVTSDLSEESSDSARNVVTRKSGPSMRRKSDLGLIKGKCFSLR